MAHEKTNQLAEDEIDFKSMFEKIKSMFIYPFKLLLTYYWITSLFVLLSLLLSIAGKYLITKTYASSFIIRPIDKTDKFHIKILNDLETLRKQKDWQTLGVLLNIDSLQLKDLVDLQAYNSVTKPQKDSINYTEIIIETTNPNLFIPLQNSILSYLENNSYFNKIKTLETEKIKRENTQIDKDLKLLDSLKLLQIQNYTSYKNTQANQLLLSEISNPVAFYGMSRDLHDKKTNLLAQENFLDNFQLIKSCVQFKKPSWPPRIIIMWAALLPTFLVLCFFYLHYSKRGSKLQ